MQRLGADPDVARLNPMVTLDPSNLDAMIVAGTNSRYNSLTVDGAAFTVREVRAQDDGKFSIVYLSKV